MLINGTHATTPTNLPTTGTGTPTGNAPTTGTGSTAANNAAAGTLGGTDFLTLMLAQLQNQDPTSPVDSNTFLTQLAQLSEVQGINSLNTSFSTLVEFIDIQSGAASVLAVGSPGIGEQQHRHARSRRHG